MRASFRSPSLWSLIVVLVGPMIVVAACENWNWEGRYAGECDDGADNDGDSFFDCNDPDCSGAPSCAADDDDDVVDVVHVEEGEIRLTPLIEPLGLEPMRTYGVALVDFDEDGLPDVTLAAKEGLFLLRNAGNWAFEDVTADWGVDSASLGDNVRQAHGVIWVDIDDDGDLDLFLVRRVRLLDDGPGVQSRLTPTLFLNNGKGRLLVGTQASGLNVQGYWEGAAFGDLDGDQDLDLIVLGGINSNSDWYENPGFAGSPGKLFRNTGSGVFEDATADWDCAGPEDSESWEVLALDLDGDGDTDLVEANDRRPSTICLNGGGGTFVDLGDSVSLNFGSPMGLDAGDLNGDGCLDVYGTNFGFPDTVLNFAPDGQFTEIYQSLVGVGQDVSAPVSGYGVSIHDTDLDGDQDVIWVAAYDTNVSDNTIEPGILAYAEGDRAGGVPSLRYISPGPDELFVSGHNSYGLAHGDLDGDGDLDFVVGVDHDPMVSDGGEPRNGRQGPPLADVASNSFLLRNDSYTEGFHHLSVTLRQEAPNARAVGAAVFVRAAGQQTGRALTSGSSFLSSHALPLHFGLGADPQPEWVLVRWPDGFEQIFTDVPGGAVTLTRSESACVPEGTCSDIALGCGG